MEDVHNHSEIELKFLLPLDTLEESGLLDECEVIKLFQAFFPREVIKKRLLPIVKEYHPQKNLPLDAPFTAARVRSTKYADSTSYTLTLKTKKDEKFHRIEVDTEIPEELYMELLMEAEDGSIGKLRYMDEGSVTDDNGQEVAVRTEIDLLTEARGKLLTRSKIDFVLIDLELPSTELVAAIRCGNHSFDYLSEAIEVTALDNEQRKALTMKYIAKNGFNETVQNVARKLLG